jgi:hypothetical protein
MLKHMVIDTNLPVLQAAGEPRLHCSTSMAADVSESMGEKKGPTHSSKQCMFELQQHTIGHDAESAMKL